MYAMNRIACYILSLIFVSCDNPSSSTETTTATRDSISSMSPTLVNDTMLATTKPVLDTMASEVDDEREIRFVVVADTSLNYYALREQLFMLHDSLQQPIDTMGRTYNKVKDLIALPEDDEDEMYAGEYYPRRTTSQDLSLEYLDMYQEAAREKSIALVTGIYENKKSADSAVRVLKRYSPKAFSVTSEIYMGCMH